MFFYYCLLAPFILIPSKCVRFFGLQLGKIYYWIDKKHRLEVLNRIQFSLGLDDSTNINLTKSFYQFLGLLILEFMRLPFQNKDRIKKIVSDENLNQIAEILKEGKGCIIATGHFGNWEYAGLALAAYGFPVNAIAKPLKNSSFDKFLNKCRQKTGTKIIYQKNAYRESLRALKANEIIVMLLDYDTAPEKGGIFIPFFGKMAATIPSAAMLHFKTKAPIIVTRLKRNKDLIHSHVEIDQVIRESEKSDKNEIIFDISTKINESYERFIKSSPPEWLWLQRRWRFPYQEKLQSENNNPPKG